MAVDMQAPRRTTGAGLWVLAGVLLTVLVLVALGAGAVAYQAGQDLDDLHRDDALAADDTVPALVQRLQAERNYATAYVLGIEDALDLGAASFDDATVATDEALVAAQGDRPAATQDSLGDVEGTLADLRGAMPPPGASRTLDEVESAESLAAGYTALIDGVLDARDEAILASQSDPDVRRGTHLAVLSLRQQHRAAWLVREVLLYGVVQPTTPEAIAGLAESVAEVQGGEAELDGLATGPYRAVADDTLAGDGLDELVSQAEAALNEEPWSGGSGVDLAAVAGGSFTEGHDAFRAEVGAVVAERMDDLESEAEDRRRTALLIAGAAVLGAVAVLAAVLVRARAR